MKSQDKPWNLNSGASPLELNHAFSSAEAEREGGLKMMVYYFLTFGLLNY
jgi:hypothetical protein